MDVEFDPAKSRRNLVERGLPFERVAEFDWTTALVVADGRRPYPEPRYLALGMIGERLHAVVFTPIHSGVRVISFRKANAREVRKHAQASPSRAD